MIVNSGNMEVGQVCSLRLYHKKVQNISLMDAVLD